MSTTGKIKELEEARAKVASLQQALEAELKIELAALPAKYGFGSVADFVAAVRKAGGARRGRKPGKARAAAAPATGGKKRRKRAVITDATRAEVQKMVAAGKTGSEIAKTVGISVQSVQNIKKALKLTRPKGAKSK